MFDKYIRWCGRLVSEDGIKLDSRRLNRFLEMDLSTTGAHIQQFICALQWVKQGIP